MNERPFFTLFPFLITLLIITSVSSVIAQGNVNSSNSSVIKSPLSINGECPYPLISLKSTGLSETDTSFCLSDCCLSCPIADNFYKENQIDLIFEILGIVRIISFVSVLIIVISYIVLPNKREYPSVTVLCFNISLMIFTSVTFFYMGNLKRIQCANLVTQSTMSNNALCGIQGIIVVFSTYLLITWCFLLILHLHFQTVWRSNIIQKYHLMLQVIIIVISVIFTVLAAAMGKLSFGFGAICLVTTGFDNILFWYPLAFFVIPGFLTHVGTFIFIGRSQFTSFSDHEYDESTTTMSDISRPSGLNVTGKEIVRAIRVQWRALMLALLLLIVYSIYWAYIGIEVDKLKPENFNPPQPWLINWMSCIFENGYKSKNAQNICSSYAIGHIPKLSHLIVAESSTATLGIFVFIIFGTSIDLWYEWKLYFSRKFGTVRTPNEFTWA